MGKVGTRDFCNNYLIVFADLRFRLPIQQWDMSWDVLRRHLPRLEVSSNDF